MTETDLAEPKQRPAHLFKPGQSGNPAGRPVGSRNRLADAFITDLRDVWAEHGAAALVRCAQEEPAQFVRVVASLMPKDINLNGSISVDNGSVLDAFRSAVAALGNTAPVALPKMKVINADRS